MSRNPILNALAATLYIVVLSAAMTLGTQNLGPDDSIVAPIAMLSVFTLSAAVMGYVFLSMPIQMYLDGKKKQAVSLFVKTVASFGVVTLAALLLLFSGLI